MRARFTGQMIPSDPILLCISPSYTLPASGQFPGPQWHLSAGAKALRPLGSAPNIARRPALSVLHSAALRSVPSGGGLRRFHACENLVRTGKGEILGGEIGRQDFDHCLVLDP